MEPIFALDIGTRVVMGLLMEKEDQGYRIIASAKTEHNQRAMYDGQVHDVEEVAQAVQRIKTELEKKSKRELTKVAIAAAGRALKTETACAERVEQLPVRWEREDVLALEMEAVQKALRQIDSLNRKTTVAYHCVGYTTLEKRLEGEEIANLIGQRGRSASISAIATFLPRTVIDGLIAVLACVGLEMTSLTLEPIAAGQAAIPPDMRRLNLALVDIGAGTSDIALTKNGSFFAYGMVPMAGDEVTESICSQYLLDFQAGERVKRELSERPELSFPDFFGNQVLVASQEIMEVIRPTVDTMANKIVEEILHLNKKVPQGIVLIGGGSQTPLLADSLAEILGIPRNRIGIQIRERLGNVVGDKSVQGPDAITPLGIGMVALSEQGLHYYSVFVNGLLIPIFELQLATVAEALLAAGIQPRSFLGKPGAALTYEWNGEIKVVKGSLGQPALLLVNDQPARLDQTLEPGDSVRFTPGISGEDATVVLKDVLPSWTAKTIWWNGSCEEFSPLVLINEQKAARENALSDGSKIKYVANQDLEDLLKQKGLIWPEHRQTTLFINGQRRTFLQEHVVTVNGELVGENCLLSEGDRINILEKPLSVADLGLKGEPAVFNVNGENITFDLGIPRVIGGGRELAAEDIVQDGMELRIDSEFLVPILADLLPLVNLATDVAQGMHLILLVNGQAAEFTTELHSGDIVRVYWE